MAGKAKRMVWTVVLRQGCLPMRVCGHSHHSKDAAKACRGRLMWSAEETGFWYVVPSFGGSDGG